MRGKRCMKCGGKKKMQVGGPPREMDFTSYEDYLSEMDKWLARGIPKPIAISPNWGDVQAPQISSDDTYQRGMMDYGVIEQKTPEEIDTEANRMYEQGTEAYQKQYDKTLGQGVLNAGDASERKDYRKFYRNKWGEGINPVDPFRLGLGIKAGTNLLSFLAGAKERKRQNQYDYEQQSALGQINPVPYSNFQPNPYLLYAKYGGNLKTIMKDYNQWSNDAQFDFGSGDNDQGLMRNGGSMNRDMSFDRQFVLRSVLPRLLKLGRLGTRKYRSMRHGGNPEMEQYHNLSQEQYDQILSDMGYHIMPDGTLMSNSEMGSNYSNINDMNNPYKQMKDGGKWIQKAINPEHKGWCTPMTKPTCTGRRRQFALMMKKKHGFQETGGCVECGEMKKGGIYIKPQNRGKFTEYCGGKVTQDCIEEGLNSPSAVIRKRANFARNARKWNRGKGGLTPNKAREILHDGTIRGKKITDRQRRFFGAMSKGHSNYGGK